MRRVSLLAILLALAPLAPALAGTPRLKPDVVVDDDSVRLGDLLADAGLAGEQAVFKAPELGATGTIQAARIVSAAREAGILDVQTDGLVSVMVRRAGRMVPVEEIRAAIKDALIGKEGLPADTTITFDSALKPLVVETKAKGSATVADLTFDPRSGRFEASITVPKSAIAERLATRISGSVGDVALVPVLARSLNRGDVVQRADFSLERRRRTELSSDVVFDPAKLAGMALKRPAKPGQWLRDSDLAKPELVERNAMVSLVLETPSITLTLRGKALSSGSEGDTVSVLNVATKKVVDGRVIGMGRVAITNPGARITAASNAN